MERHRPPEPATGDGVRGPWSTLRAARSTVAARSPVLLESVRNWKDKHEARGSPRRKSWNRVNDHVVVPDDVLLDRDRRAEIAAERADPNAVVLGDPLPSRSALDRKMKFEEIHGPYELGPEIGEHASARSFTPSETAKFAEMRERRRR